jgi:hypothetical protein
MYEVHGMIRTQEIPRGEWASFFNRFSRQHAGWLVTVKVRAPELGTRVEAKDLPLRGLSLEPGRDEPSRIAILLERPHGAHLTHFVDAPARIRLKQTEAGADLALQIQSAGRVGTQIVFRSAMRPEMVDGIASDA